MANTSNLEEMKLPELRELAKQLGLRGISGMRKGDLVATIHAARTGREAPAGVTVRAPKAASQPPAPHAEEPAGVSSEAASTDAAGTAEGASDRGAQRAS
ncbi:MAG: Rho termination factor N-terminal domain-containing protein, partial [Bifidobacterium sp.]|nr:Rho termination factor N-terminal domain-containing protein [Bifidobacterium sp.]